MVKRKYHLVENGQCASQSEFLPRLLVFEGPDIVSEHPHENDLMTLDDGSVNYFWKTGLLLQTVHNIFLQVESLLFLIL